MDRLNTLARRVPVNAVYAAGFLPFLWIVWLTFTNGLGPDPVFREEGARCDQRQRHQPLDQQATQQAKTGLAA